MQYKVLCKTIRYRTALSPTTSTAGCKTIKSRTEFTYLVKQGTDVPGLGRSNILSLIFELHFPRIDASCPVAVDLDHPPY